MVFVSARVEPTMGTSSIRRKLATLAALGGAAAMYVLGPWSVVHGPSLQLGNREWLVLWMPVLLLGASSVLMHRRSLAGQLLARAVWWSNLVLGGIIFLCSSGHERPLGLLLALGSGGALVLAGKERLDEKSASFAPIAYRGTLTAILVMALADVQSLFLFGVLSWRETCCGASHHAQSLALLVVGGALAIAMLGLFRLRVWGLALAALGNLALVGVVVSWGQPLPSGLMLAYLGSAIVQLVLIVRITVGLVRGR